MPREPQPECEEIGVDDEGVAHYCYLRPAHRGGHEAKCWSWSRSLSDTCEPEFFAGWVSEGVAATAPWPTVQRAPWLSDDDYRRTRYDITLGEAVLALASS